MPPRSEGAGRGAGIGAPPTSEQIATEILALAHRRGAGKTLCPSEVARALAADWRALMPAVRAEAARLQAEGSIQATQKGCPVDPATARGAIRLGLAAGRGTPPPKRA